MKVNDTKTKMYFIFAEFFSCAMVLRFLLKSIDFQKVQKKAQSSCCAFCHLLTYRLNFKITVDFIPCW